MKAILRSIAALGRNLKLYMIADGFYYAGYSVINAFLSILITAKITNGRIDIVGYVVAYYLFLRAIAEIPISRITKSLSFQGRVRLVMWAYVFYGILIIWLGFATTLIEVIVVQTLAALTDATSYPIKWTLFTRSIAREEELTWALEDIPATILPALFTALAGYLSIAFGLSAPFFLFGFLLIVSGILFGAIRPKATIPAVRDGPGGVD